MIALLRHLLDPAYLFAQRTGPGEAWGVAHLALVGCLLAGAALAWRRRRLLPGERVERGMWAASAGTLLAAGALCAAQRVTAGPLSARAWYLSAMGVGVTLAAGATTRRPLARFTWLAQSLDAATGRLRPQAPFLPATATIPLAAAHLAGMAALLSWREAGWWLPALALGCLGVAGWRRVEVLTPLFVSYAGWALRALVGDALGVETWRYLAFPYPDPWSLWFDAGAGYSAATLTVGVGGTLLATGAYAMRRLGVGASTRRRVVAAALAGAAVLWFVAMVAAHRSHGATGSDAFCYLQMAVDLARHGAARHTYPLAALLWEHGLPAWPAVPVGYHPPDPAGGAVTVWPIGWPVLLAGLVRLGGEGLALWGAPLCALVAAGLTYLLAREAAGGEDSSDAALAGALAAGVLLTSPEGALRALAPMADAAAQALAAGTILCLWRGRSRDRLLWSALAGLLLAWAYWVRHPLLPLGLAALPAILVTPWSWRRRMAHLGVLSAAALVGALPDLAYHQRAFGSIWTAESPEWFLLSWRHIVPSLGAMLRDGWLRREEFGYLAPFILAGIAWQWRHPRRRAMAATLTTGLLGALLFNLAYSALRLRDLLPLFPWGALWAGWGMLAAWRWATSRAEGGRLRRAAVLLAIAMALAARASPSLGLPWREGVWTFGHVTASQRDAYDALAAALPPDAVVAAGLNAGAVGHYTGRDAVRPGPWTGEERAAFAALLSERGRPLYLLVDGEEMEDVLVWARDSLALEPAGSFDIPMMGRGGQWQEGPATLYAVARR